MTADTPDRTARATTRLLSSERRVHHRVCGHLQVGQQFLAMLVVERLRVYFRHRGVHAAQPCVALDVADPERGVTHPQPRMAALIGVGPRTAPILLEKHPQPFLRAVEIVFGVDRTQDLVLADQLIEPRHDGMERVVAAHGVIEGVFRLCHGTIVSCLSNMPVSRSCHRLFTGLTCGHEPICYAIHPNPWWTVRRRTYGASQQKPR